MVDSLAQVGAGLEPYGSGVMVPIDRGVPMIRRPQLRSVATVVTVAVTLGLGALPSAGQDAAEGEDGTASVAEASAALGEAEANHDRLDGSLSELTAERERLLADLGARGDRRERATQDLIRARDGAHSLAVLAYMTADVGTVVLGSGPDPDDVYRDTLLRDGADARLQAAAYYQDLRRQADTAVTTTLSGLDELEAEIEALSASRDVALDDVRAASTDLEAARAAEARHEADRQAAADLAALPDPPPVGNPPADDGPWTPIGTIPGGPSPQQWAQLRNCESGGNYQAVSAGGAFRGAYQFDLSTWRTMGGTGDPISASAAEQDHRAQLLWQSRGHAPWPVCGRFLL
jgi:hypothetical protein